MDPGKGGMTVLQLQEKKLFLLDMDGTIYLGDRLFDGTLDFLAQVRARGGRALYLTNNSSKSVTLYVDKLKRMGISAGEEDFVTSVNALIPLLRPENFRRIYVLGTRAFLAQLAEAGLPVTDELSDDIDCLCAGFDTELTFRKLEDACILLNRGAAFFAANPDWVCPTWYGSVPDCGSVCEMLFRATGRRPRFAGKPQPDMVYQAMAQTGFSPEETVLLGDRLYTDIASGVRAGVDTVLVLSGEARREDIPASPEKPAWVLPDIRAVEAVLAGRAPCPPRFPG